MPGLDAVEHEGSNSSADTLPAAEKISTDRVDTKRLDLIRLRIVVSPGGSECRRGTNSMGGMFPMAARKSRKAGQESLLSRAGSRGQP